MAKKTKKSSKSTNFNLIFLLIAVVTILYLMAQNQDKDKQLKLLRNNPESEVSGDNKASTKDNITKPRRIIILSKEQETAARAQIHEHLDKIISQKPKMASKWVLSDIKFKDNGTVTLYYEDGHEAGEITLSLSDPADYRTWKKTGGE